MTVVKSLYFNTDTQGYKHRVHRSKKGRVKDYTKKRIWKQILGKRRAKHFERIDKVY